LATLFRILENGVLKLLTILGHKRNIGGARTAWKQEASGPFVNRNEKENRNGNVNGKEAKMEHGLHLSIPAFPFLLHLENPYFSHPLPAVFSPSTNFACTGLKIQKMLLLQNILRTETSKILTLFSASRFSLGIKF